MPDRGGLMKQNFLMFMIKHFFIFTKQHKISALVIISFVFAPSVIFAAYNSNAFDNANVVRDTQLLLAVTGLYTGPIDGQCNPQTKHAIAQYQGTSKRSYDSNDLDCNTEILNTIKAELTDKLQTITSSPKDIDEIKTSLKNTNAALKGLTDGFASNFLSQYHSLASSGISAFVAAISGTIAIIGLASALLKDFIKEHINSHISEASKHLRDTAQREHTTLAAQIYARLAGRILYSQLKNFYDDNTCPQQTNRRDRYMGYLEGGSHISTVGNNTANDLISLYKENNEEIPDDAYKWINACRNNFIFYIASENDVSFNKSNTEESIKNVGDAAKAITELDKMLLDDRKKDFLLDNKETLIWAKLCLGLLRARDVKTQIELLARNTNATTKWKKDVQARYDFYDRFTEHTEKVDLSIA